MSDDLLERIEELQAQLDQMRIDWAESEMRLHDKYAKTLVERDDLKAKLEIARKALDDHSLSSVECLCRIREALEQIGGS